MKLLFLTFVVRPLLGFLPFDWRDFLHGLKRFRAKDRIFPSPAIIFFTEKDKNNGGFADRMKGIVSIFHFCLCENIPFKINYAVPFELSDFLLPNEYDWQIDKQQISFHRKDARFFHLYGTIDESLKLKRLLKLKSKKQVQVFFNLDFVPELNKVFGVNYIWGDLYKKLFKPTDKLQSAIDKHKKIINGDYICAVFRFQNLLDDFQEYHYPSLRETEQDILMRKCSKALLELQKKESNEKILVTSDSLKFLSRIKGLK